MNACPTCGASGEQPCIRGRFGSPIWREGKRLGFNHSSREPKNTLPLTMLEYMGAVRQGGMLAREHLVEFGYSYSQVNARARDAERLGYIEYDIGENHAGIALTGTYVFPPRYAEHHG